MIPAFLRRANYRTGSNFRSASMSHRRARNRLTFELPDRGETETMDVRRWRRGFNRLPKGRDGGGCGGLGCEIERRAFEKVSLL